MGRSARWLIFAPAAILAFTSTVSASTFTDNFNNLTGWTVIRNGGNGVLANGVLQFSYGWGEVRRGVLVSEPSTVTVTVQVNNSVTNSIGWGAPIADTYEIHVGDSVLVSNEIHGWRTVTVTTETVEPDQVVWISLAGIDRGFWAGWYGTQMDDLSVSLEPSAPPTDTEAAPIETDPSTSVPVSTTVEAPSPSTVPETTSSTEPISTTTASTTVPSTTTTTILQTPTTQTTEAVPIPLPQTTSTTTSTSTTTTVPETTIPETTTTETTTSTTSTTLPRTTTTATPETLPEPPQSLPNASETPTPIGTTPTTFLSLEAIPEPAVNAPDEVKEEFEAQVNIFDGSHDDYVPVGSKVSVAERRTIVAATTILMTLPAPTRRTR